MPVEANVLRWLVAARGTPRTADRVADGMATTARDVISTLFERLSAGDDPGQLAEHYAEDVDWLIPGDIASVPWIGRKTGRAGVAEFFTQLRELTTPGHFTVEIIVGDADRCVVLGNLRTHVNATGKILESDFAFDVAVHDGLITRYHMFEDTWAVSRAAQPTAA